MATFHCRNDNFEPDDTKDIEADEASDAAAEFAEWHDNDSCDYPKEQEVIVVDSKGRETKWRVEAERVRRYTAYPA